MRNMRGDESEPDACTPLHLSLSAPTQSAMRMNVVLTLNTEKIDTKSACALGILPDAGFDNHSVFKIVPRLFKSVSLVVSSSSFYC